METLEAQQVRRYLLHHYLISDLSKLFIPLFILSSSIGGSQVNISGTGFNVVSPSSNAVWFGKVPCFVATASFTSVVCVTGSALDYAGNDLLNFDRVISKTSFSLKASSIPLASDSTALNDFPAITFSFDPNDVEIIASVNTTRGSTAGGTKILITGSFKLDIFHEVLFVDQKTGLPSGSMCIIDDLGGINEDSIICETTEPPSANPDAPYAIKVS